MATFTVSIPEDLKKKLEFHPEINWAEYLKQRFKLKINELKKLKTTRKR